MDYVDVLIVGAGISGIGAAVHLGKTSPGKSIAIIEARDSIGGTWDDPEVKFDRIFDNTKKSASKALGAGGLGAAPAAGVELLPESPGPLEVQEPPVESSFPEAP